MDCFHENPKNNGKNTYIGQFFYMTIYPVRYYLFFKDNFTGFKENFLELFVCLQVWTCLA